jgi:hypothetical protein
VISFQCSICPKPFCTVTHLWKLVYTKPCIRWDHVSNWQKADVVSNNFNIRSFQGCLGKILPRDKLRPRGQVCPDFSASSTRQVLIAVTWKPLTVWSCKVNHRKVEKITYWIGIRKSGSSVEPRLRILGLIQLLICPKRIPADLSMRKIL